MRLISLRYVAQNTATMSYKIDEVSSILVAEQILAHLDKTEGKLNKFFKKNTLLNQPFVKDNTQTVKKYLDSVTKGLTVESFKRVSIGG